MSLECEEISGKGHCVLPVINFGTMFYEITNESFKNCDSHLFKRFNLLIKLIAYYKEHIYKLFSRS